MKGGDAKIKIPPACKNADHLCSYTCRTTRDSVFSLPSTWNVRSFGSECTRLSECRGACGRSPLAGGTPSTPQSEVVKPSNTTSHAKSPGFLVPYLSAVQMIELTSWSKKNSTVIMAPGMIAPRIHPIGIVQNSTKKRVRFGSVGRNEVLTGKADLSRAAKSPTCGRPTNKTMDIAAAYSFRPVLKWRWNNGFQLSAVESKMAVNMVPTAPIIAYRNAANDKVS